MKLSRFSEKQIIAVLKEQEGHRTSTDYGICIYNSGLFVS